MYYNFTKEINVNNEGFNHDIWNIVVEFYAKSCASIHSPQFNLLIGFVSKYCQKICVCMVLKS